MKKKLLLVFFLSILTSCEGILFAQDKNETLYNQQLSESILGNWMGTHHDPESYEKEYRINFISASKFYLEYKAEHGSLNEMYKYNFLNEETILVESKRVLPTEWVLNYENKELIICMGLNDFCVSFSRYD